MASRFSLTRSASSNAVKALGNNVKEYRIHLCQTSSSSKGVRKFIEEHYVNLKVANPNLPFMVRECSGVVPRIYARYDFGLERAVDVSGMSSSQVLTSLQSLAKTI